MAESSLTTNPVFRIQVLLENEPGKPTKEFKAGDLSEPSFNALAARTFQMALPNADPDQYNSTFKYRLEERHESRWVNFENTEGLGFAIQSNEFKGYIFISASFVQKGVAAPVLAVSPEIVSSSPQDKTKRKVAKKTKTTKHKVSTRGQKMPVEQKILSALKELLELGITSPPRKQVALFSGYSNVQSKGFSNAMSKLSKKELIAYPDKKTVALTPAGTAQAGAVTPPTSNAEVQERIKNLLKPKETELFNHLSDGRAHAREKVAAGIGYTNVQSKGFSNALSKMSTLGILEHLTDDTDTKKKMVRLTDIAFPFGRSDANGGYSDTAMSIVSNDDAVGIKDERA